MSETKETMITTIDNPWNPFTNWDEWYAYDEWHGYHTCSLVDRLMPNTNVAISEKLYNDLLDDVNNDIVRLNPLGIYALITKDDKAPLKESKQSRK